MGTLIQDVRYGLRMLGKNPGFTAVAVLTLALGVGANTAIFNVINAVMLRRLPVEKPAQLVQIRFRLRQADEPRATYTNPLWEQVRDHQDVFAGVLAWSPEVFDLAEGGEAREVHGIYASGGYFSTLGVRPAIGRLLTPEDDRRGCSGVAVLGYGFWQQHYAGAETAIGSLLRLNGHSFPVIGVTPPRFFGTDVGEQIDVALPICAEATLRGKDSLLDHRSGWWLLVMGRLAPGSRREEAAARLNVLAPQIFAASVPPNWRAEDQQAFRTSTFAIAPAATGLTGFSGLREHYERPLGILMLVVGFVLLIACANIASLMMARAAAREREFAVRLSLGASRRRVIRQLLTESLVLSGAGALLGILFAQWGSLLLVRLVSPTTSRLFLDLSMDGRVLGFTAGLGVLTGLLFGLWPAWRATRVSLTSAMKGSEERPRESRSQFRSGRWIVAAQVALSLVLLVGTGLFVRSFLNLLTLDPGFDRRNVLMVRVNVHNAGIPPGARIPLYVQILDRLKSLPGVVSVGQVWFTPISGMEWNNNIQVEGSLPSPGKEPLVWFDGITPGYFATLRTPLLAGRDFDNRDTATSPRVAIVNETLARRFFPNANAVGKYFRTPGSDGASSPPTQIVGIVKDSKYLSLREEILPFAYVPLPQADFIAEDSTFLIRTAASPAALIPTAREAIAGVNKAASLRFATLAQQVDDSLVPERLLATLSAFFGGLALLLTAIGLYGVMAYLVTRRTHEIGLRMALGARQGSILRLVLRDSAVLLGAGIAAGTAGALWVTQFVRYLLFGLAPRDAGTLAVAVAVLLAVGLVASYLPARRATKVDPMVALRYE